MVVVVHSDYYVSTQLQFWWLLICDYYLEPQEWRSRATSNKLQERPLLTFIKTIHNMPESSDGGVVHIISSRVVSVCLEVSNTYLMLCS